LQCQRHLGPERLRCLEVDDKLEFGRLLHRQVAGFLPLRMLPRRLPTHTWQARTIRVGSPHPQYYGAERRRPCHALPFKKTPTLSVAWPFSEGKTGGADQPRAIRKSHSDTIPDEGADLM
jgi:hypothetical protein